MLKHADKDFHTYDKPSTNTSLVDVSIIDWDTIIGREHTYNKMMARKIVSLALITNHILTQWFVLHN